MNLPQPIQQVDRTYVRVGKRRFSYFAGCDYFRLASHPKVLRALNDGAKRYGLNVAASRMTTGNHELLLKLEKALERFFDVKSATLVSNGYVTNLIAAQALAGEFSHVILDEKAHPSLLDAALFLDCPILKFKHRDAKDLSRVAARIKKNAQPILLADGMFSHDGSLTPLAEYLRLLPKTATLLIDDAHGAGTLGQTGKGSPELAGIPRNRVIQTITLSKAFGVYGGAILGTKELREKILTRSRMFGGSTPLPLPLANAALTSIQILQKDKNLRRRLEQNVAFVKTTLREAGLEVSPPPSPIFAIVPKTESAAEDLKACCLQNSIFPSFIKYHGGPPNGYFRFAISSEHTREQLAA
ncbi:MAG: pyridoxal phosphate-dependent aminotransferase family protein, partial [Verrucomicrobiota bacterium]